LKKTEKAKWVGKYIIKLILIQQCREGIRIRSIDEFLLMNMIIGNETTSLCIQEVMV